VSGRSRAPVPTPTPTPTLVLTPAARQWILDHGGAVTIRHSPRHGCCGGRALLPVADAMTPTDEAAYEREVIDGVTIHRARSLTGPDVVTIDLAGFWRWRRLVVEGAGFGASGSDA